MPSKRYLKEAILEAMRELTFYSYDDGWLLSRTLAPTVSLSTGARVSSKSVGKHLSQMEADGYVEKQLVNPTLGLHKWRIKEWIKWTHTNSAEK